MKVISIVGARPQFIKLAAMHRAIINSEGLEHKVIHTRQHYDANMSAVFFKELGTPKPDYFLDLTEINLAANIPRMREGIVSILTEEQPAMVLVYGDTNSTLAAAQAAKSLSLPVAHIEAGLRSYDTNPEEDNRIETDKISDLLFCPSRIAVENLAREGFNMYKIIFSGDVMFDAIKYYLPEAERIYNPAITETHFALATIHRQRTVQSSAILTPVIKAFNEINKKMRIIFPVHPGTRKAMEATGEKIEFELLQPVGYLEMLSLLSRCSLVLTDSGGLQKEAFFSNKICVTLRDNTEWKELVAAGVNFIAGTEYQNIMDTFELAKVAHPSFEQNYYGSGNSARIITDEIIKYLKRR